MNSVQPDTNQPPAKTSESRIERALGSIHNAPAAGAPLAHTQPSTPPDDAAPFVGETSMAHTLNQVEDRFQKIRTVYQLDSSAPPICPKSPPHHSADGEEGQGHHADYVHVALRTHGIIADRVTWDQWLRAFMQEVHALYPILHFPTLQQKYHQLWSDALDGQTISRSHTHQAQVGQILICLAIGRCISASRAGSEEVRHASGWSLYSAAMDLLGGESGLFTLNGPSHLVLQTLTLMVVYLLILDANERASKVIAVVISHSHQLGLHRERVLSNMPIFESEIFRRLWWCVYVLDRQVALETGLPFIIQDINIDTGFPLELSDDWLLRYTDISETADGLKTEVDNELSTHPITPIPYLACMIRYSKVIGKVWEALYRARGTHTTEMLPDVLTQEYLERLISSAEAQTPPCLTYELSQTFGDQITGLRWWQVKQKAIMHMRWTFLRLCIRRPMLNRASSSGFASEMDSVENEFTCMKLTRSIFDQFNEIPGHHPKFHFPFYHYLARTTMISLGLIIKEPSFRQAYGTRTLQMSRDIKLLCRRTWVSGKFVRSVLTLNRMAETVLGHDSAVPITKAQGTASSVIPSGFIQSKDTEGCSYKNSPRDPNHICLLKHGSANPSAVSEGVSRSQTPGPSSSGGMINEPSMAQNIDPLRASLSPFPASFTPLLPLSIPEPQANPNDNMDSLRSDLLDHVTQGFDFERAFNGDNTHHTAHLSHFTSTPRLYSEPGYMEGLSGSSQRQDDACVNDDQLPGFHAERNSVETGSNPQADTHGAGIDWVQDLLGAGFHADPFSGDVDRVDVSYQKC
ncbi:fungal-specific transcription factor domain-containing protein [Aspergillus aurantiobrunneus]